MSLVLLISLFVLATVQGQLGGRYGYLVNDLLDEALVQLNTKVASAGDDALEFEEPVGVGGFVLYGPKLRDSGSWMRTGDAWLVPLDDAVEVLANLSLGRMYLDGERLVGPGKDAEKPRINVRENMISIKMTAHAETTNFWLTAEGDRVVAKRCRAGYRPSVVSMSSVVLVTRHGVSSLDPWVSGLFAQITGYMDPVLRALFEKHFDLCLLLRKNGYKLWKTGGDF